MQINPELIKTFQEFQKLRVGYIIDKPDDIVFTGLSITKQAAGVLKVKPLHIFFTRKSLKHLSEKHDSEMLFELFPKIIHSFEHIYKGKIHRRFLLSKTINDQSYLTFAVSLETSEKNSALIVTIFRTDSDYLKNFEILWRTGAP